MALNGYLLQVMCVYFKFYNNRIGEFYLIIVS